MSKENLRDGAAQASPPKASIPDAVLDELRAAALNIARQAELDMCRDWPEGVDGSHLDRVREAVNATYPTIWTSEQVERLNEFQNGYGHAFTCPNRSEPLHRFYQDEEEGEDLGQLYATPQGWICHACDYRQFNAHDFMFNGAMPNPLDMLKAAQAIEAGTAKTEGLGPKDESAVTK